MIFFASYHDVGGAARVMSGVLGERDAHAQADVAVTCHLHFIAIRRTDQATVMVPSDLHV